MMRLSCQSRKQQAQPEKGCPAARDGCVGAVRTFTGWGGGSGTAKLFSQLVIPTLTFSRSLLRVTRHKQC